ncbi:MAG TPA: RdgB/HAM1 family non-canonical purine NTP pyrophosphatase, partial [Gammaproteobacteria bacterium]|nr:RdgB/HAM1 family non-canonical purine NTP pyrophosphatase [Gammaproteobacteria bacterium]
MTEPTRIVIASNNAGKLKEMQALLEPLGISPVTQQSLGIEAAEETGLTFIENAILKARHAARESGLPALADDSGLAVDALHGAPGIYSARFAGNNTNDAANNEKLLQALENVPDTQRTARYHCVIVYLTHNDDPTPIIAHGQFEGCILTAPQGSNGFGYDPLFFIASENATAAQLTPERKNAISHRGQALRALIR